MEFIEKVDPVTAQADVNTLLDKKKMLPSKRKNFEKVIETIVEAVVYGFVTIDENGIAVQKLIDPILDVTKTPVLTELTYKARLEPETVNKKVAELKAGSNQSVLVMAYASMATGQPVGLLSKLEPSDSDICDALSTLFL